MTKTLTLTLTRTRLAAAVAVAALAVPATALAAGTFEDVADDKFYAAPVEWALENGITTGKSPTTFAPDAPVTRGENVTFLQRYHENVAEPGLAEIQAQLDANAAAIAANEDAIAANEAAIAANGEASAANGEATEDNAVAITAVADRPVTHWAAVAPDGSLIGTSYPGATAAADEVLGDGVFVVEFPGLEWIGDEQFECGVQTSGVGFESLVFTSLVFTPALEERSDAIWTVAVDGFDPSAEAPGFVMVTITC